MSVWRETPFYPNGSAPRWPGREAVTLVSVDHVPDDVYDLARQHFAERELVDLTLAIVAINHGTVWRSRSKPCREHFSSVLRHLRTGGARRGRQGGALKGGPRDDHIETRVRPGLAHRWHPLPGGTAVAARCRKAKLRVDAWLKEVGPSTELRKWFSHDPEKWDEFRRRYFRELDSRPEAWQPIVSAARRGPVTLVYSSHDTQHNNAVALQRVLAKEGAPAGEVQAGARAAPAARDRCDECTSWVTAKRQLTFVLRPIPPFRLDLTVWALRRRPRNLIDRWDGTTYRRVIVVGGRPTELAVRQAGSSAAPRLIVTATPPPRDAAGETTCAIDCRSAARASDRSDRLVPHGRG